MTNDIPSWCFRGAKVICVDVTDYMPTSYSIQKDLTLGKEYTIERVEVGYIHPSNPFKPHVAVHIVGVRDYSVGRVPFYVSRFRPVKTIETDMEEHFNVFLDVKEPV